MAEKKVSLHHRRQIGKRGSGARFGHSDLKGGVEVQIQAGATNLFGSIGDDGGILGAVQAAAQRLPIEPCGKLQCCAQSSYQADTTRFQTLCLARTQPRGLRAENGMCR